MGNKQPTEWADRSNDRRPKLVYACREVFNLKTIGEFECIRARLCRSSLEFEGKRGGALVYGRGSLVELQIKLMMTENRKMKFGLSFFYRNLALGGGTNSPVYCAEH